MKYIHKLFRFLFVLLAGCITSCSNHESEEVMNQAEILMEAHPDSALSLLSGIDINALSGKKQEARYALLKSMALDKNYVDTTSFDVLQPAIDYYLDNGTPDEKLRTYYYQGRIFQNLANLDSALWSFEKGIDMAKSCTDSLCIARTLVAEAIVYYAFHDLNQCMSIFLEAARLYNAQSYKEQEFDCLINAFNNSVILEDRMRADSLYKVCKEFEYVENDELFQQLQSCNLTYVSVFGSLQEVKDYVDNLDENIIWSDYSILNLALAYNKLGDNETAFKLLEYLNKTNIEYDTLKYQAAKVTIFKAMGNYKDALSTYEEYTQTCDSITSHKFMEKSQSLEERHQMELNAQEEATRKSRIIWACVIGIVVLTMIIIILVLFVRGMRSKKELALEKVKAKETENDLLKFEKEKLVLENENLQLERNNKALEAENLAHRVEILENDCDNLKSIMESQKELPEEVQNAIKVRIEMLNALLASYITTNNQYEKPYDIWIKELTENTKEFMNSNRLAFQVSHPHFIQYFEDHGLTTEEINYVCLYAIGLRGKEVGSYIKKRSHVNTSSAIRKKLGIDKHETNIGIYVRKLLKSL